MLDRYKFKGEWVQFTDYLEPLRDVYDVIDTGRLYDGVLSMAVVENRIILKGEYRKNYCLKSRDSDDVLIIEFKGDGCSAITRFDSEGNEITYDIYDTHWPAKDGHMKKFTKLLNDKFEFKY